LSIPDNGGLTSVGNYTSITIGSDGLGLVSYLDDTNGDLKVGHCANVLCTSFNGGSAISIAAGSVGLASSITIGRDGLGLISSRAIGAANSLYITHCLDLLCNSSATFASETGNVSSTSITVGGDGLGLAAFGHQGQEALKIFHCADSACSAAIGGGAIDSGFIPRGVSVATPPDGTPLISYYNTLDNTLKLARCFDSSCSFASTHVLDSVGTLSLINLEHTSITIGTDGFALIAYSDAANADLKVVHLTNFLGIPYRRRR
jgi:hypothetical protein